MTQDQRGWLKTGEDHQATPKNRRMTDLLDRGNEREGLEAFESAKDYFERTIALAPDYDLALRNLGKIYMQTEGLERAYEQFDRLIIIGKASYDDLWLGAETLQRFGRFGLCARLLESRS